MAATCELSKAHPGVLRGNEPRRRRRNLASSSSVWPWKVINSSCVGVLVARQQKTRTGESSNDIFWGGVPFLLFRSEGSDAAKLRRPDGGYSTFVSRCKISIVAT